MCYPARRQDARVTQPRLRALLDAGGRYVMPCAAEDMYCNPARLAQGLGTEGQAEGGEGAECGEIWEGKGGGVEGEGSTE